MLFWRTTITFELINAIQWAVHGFYWNIEIYCKTGLPNEYVHSCYQLSFPSALTSTQKVPSDWERVSFQQTNQASPDLKTSPQNGASFPSSGGYGQGSLIADEESQEFDDLIFALKTGMYEAHKWHLRQAVLGGYFVSPSVNVQKYRHPRYILSLMTHFRAQSSPRRFCSYIKYNTA